MGIDGGAHPFHQTRQGIREIAILAAAKAMPRHHHRAAEDIVLVIERRDAVAVRAAQQARQHRPALTIQFGRRQAPILFQSGHGARLAASASAAPPIFCVQTLESSGMITIYGIKNCDTMKKARTWLDGHKVTYAFHDYKASGIDKPTLEGWAKKVGWEIL